MWHPELDQHRAESRAFNQQLEAVLADMAPIESVPPDESRLARLEGTGAFPAPQFLDHARDETIAGPAGDLGLRILPAKQPRGVYLHIHGGGWVLGAAIGQDVALDRIVRATGLTAVSVEYRLAPEHPYPAAPDDCEAAARWLLERGLAELGAPPLVVIGGESAGAHLALVTLLRLRDRHDALAPFAGANLVYGVYDLSGTPSQRRWDRNLVLSPGNLAWFYHCFVGSRPVEARRDPDISPLYAELSGLPPMLLTVGLADPLLDDSLFLDARLRAAGGPCEVAVYPDSVHGFNAFPLAMARAANERIDAWIASRVGGRQSGDTRLGHPAWR
jgi:acetyl esterase